MTKSPLASPKFARSPTALIVAAIGMVSTSAWSQSSSCPQVFNFSTQSYIADSSCSSSDKDVAFSKANPITSAIIQSQITTLSEVSRSRSGGNTSSTRTSLTGQTGLAGAAGDSRWSAWAALSSNNVGYNFAPLSSSGNALNALIGIDYLYANGVLAGFALGSDSSKTNTSFNNGNISTSGYTFSPYFMAPLSANWTLDGSLGFGSGKISTNVGGGVNGNTTDQRTFGALALTYSTSLSNWQVQSTGSILTSSSKINQLTLSNAAVVAGTTNGATQLRAGARAYYGSGQFVPFVGLTYSQDLGRTDVQAVGGQTPANARNAFIALVGVGINQGKQVSGSVQLTSEIRNQVRNNGVLGSVSLKF